MADLFVQELLDALCAGVHHRQGFVYRAEIVLRVAGHGILVGFDL